MVIIPMKLMTASRSVCRFFFLELIEKIDYVYFQQDSATAHTAGNLMAALSIDDNISSVFDDSVISEGLR
jgi:hypothetical protein